MIMDFSNGEAIYFKTLVVNKKHIKKYFMFTYRSKFFFFIKSKNIMSIASTFKSIHSVRRTIAYILEKYPLSVLNRIPEGQSNNIVWNAAHLVSVQQLLINRRSGAPYTEAKELTANYKPGTKPEGDVDQAFVDNLRMRLIANAEEMEKMYNDGGYPFYESFQTRTKISLDSVEDAINFELFHNGLHLGYIMSYLNLLTNK